MDRRRWSRRFDVGPRRPTAQHLDELAETFDAAHLSERRDLRFVGAGDRDHGVDGAEHANHRYHTRDGTDRAVEPELADEAEAPDRLRRDLLAGDQHADGDRQVEARPRLAMARRREVDGDPLRRRPPGPLHSSAERDPVRGFAACLVGKADDREGGQADADVHLDGDGMALCPEERCGLDGGEHGDLLRSQHGAAAVTGGTVDRPTTAAWHGTAGL